MSNILSNHWKYLMNTGVPDFDSDTFKIILMETGFVFDPDNHALYADVVGNELPTLNGYTAGGETLVLTAPVDEDDVNDRSNVAWDPMAWTAAGGPIGPSPGAIVFDDTLAGDPIVGWIPFGAEYTQADGGTATLHNLGFRQK